jgi:hypothetical protein
MNCPICKAKNVTAAHILGHGGKGKAKTISEADRQARKERMNALNAQRAAQRAAKRSLPRIDTRRRT